MNVSWFLIHFPWFQLINSAMGTRKFSLVWESSWRWTSSWTEATLVSLCLFPRGGRSSPGQMFPSQVQRWENNVFYFLLPLAPWIAQHCYTLLTETKVSWKILIIVIRKQVGPLFFFAMLEIRTEIMGWEKFEQVAAVLSVLYHCKLNIFVF